MKLLITGHNGFIGRNAKFQLRDRFGCDIKTFGKYSSDEDLEELISESDFICHFAGINKSTNQNDFNDVNYGLTLKICNISERIGRKLPILFTSSIHAENDNEYGISKKKAEKVLLEYSNKTGARVYIFRLPHVVGKWCKPNYNSVVSTFCYNIANDLPIKIYDPNHLIEIVYIDDFIEEIYHIISDEENSEHYCKVKTSYTCSIQQLADIIYAFKEDRLMLRMSEVGMGFKRALYATYISYLPTENFAYEINSKEDERGKFVELFKSQLSGQVSFLTIKPGKIRGGHYHHTKTEKFVLISGKVNFRFKNILSDEFYEIPVSDQVSMMVETIPGWSHDIKNVGNKEAIIIVLANEVFNPEKSDTIQKKL